MIDYTCPYVIEPNRVWRTWRGGRRLDEIAGAADPTDGEFPEDWIASTTRAANAGREHLADEGLGTLRHPVTGQTLRMDAFIEADPAAALGTAHLAAYGPNSRLLVKLLDSATRLHIQAHPSADWAAERLASPSGKTEAWWILDVRDAVEGEADCGWVYLGFQHAPRPQRWREIIETQDLEAMAACFEKIPVRPGDVLLVEGGTPHAIGPGLLLLEVQEPTDFVVRCEYGHGGRTLSEKARTMGLGLDAVLDLFDYREVPADQVAARFGPRTRTLAENESGREVSLLAAPQTQRLELRRLEVAGTFSPGFDGRFSVLLCTGGDGEIAWTDPAGEKHAMELHPWSRLLLPAALSAAKLNGHLTCARCLPPPTRELGRAAVDPQGTMKA